IVIDDDNVHIAVVIEVSECAATARVKCVDAGSGLPQQFFEASSSQIPKYDSWRVVVILYLRVDTAGDREKSRIAVIVQIQDSDAPCNQADLTREPDTQRSTVTN